MLAMDVVYMNILKAYQVLSTTAAVETCQSCL